MTETTKWSADKLTLAGIYFLAISFLIFWIPIKTTEDTNLGVFALNYILAITYMIICWIDRSGRNIFLVLVLFFISAWSLNRSMTIFEDSTPWFAILMILYSVNYIALAWFEKVSERVRQLMCILLGGALVLFIYLSIYLIPTYPICAFAFFVLGVSLHAFVPILFVIFTIRKAITIMRANRNLGRYMLAGIIISVIIPLFFTFQWNQVNKQVSKSYNKTLYADNTELPAWIKVAQNLDDNKITEQFLKGNLIYTMPSGNFLDMNWGMPHKNFDEIRQHDPLVMIAGLFSKQPDISTDDRIRILESMYVSRHHTQDRLWNGDNLATLNIISNIRLWPEQRIAYTEKTITVKNSGETNRWWNKEEAIYTFHLPEGGVVTSLSLWIDGKEQKGALTTRHKADSAYRQIVGVENHDPSLVKWQEGNTVTVRVFPVLQHESRVFKIGITAPLTLAGKRLVYENIWFEGPGLEGATETRQVDWVKIPQGFNMPEGFTQNGPRRFIKESNYDPNFRIEFNDPGLHPEGFSFDGNTYSVQTYTPQRGPQVFKKVYLDINNSWTTNELNQVYEMVKNKEVYIYNDGLIQLTNENINKPLVTNLLQQRFSLFPFYMVDNPGESLVVTKNDASSPNLADLKESEFADSLEKKFRDGTRIKIFNLSATLSPYLKGLKEHRCFDYEFGNTELLNDLLNKNTFARSLEDDNHLIIDNAGILLTRSNDSNHQKGPDHLMRLFAYNHLMSQLKSKLFSNAECDSLLVNEAEQANIVTPLSSLIVLESQQDYDRFNIQKNANSLDNATLKSTGSSPEPHEWALIIMATLALAWVKYKEKFKLALLRRNGRH